MTKKRLKILFISHDSSLTGAPILLLNLLKLLVSQDWVEMEILLYRGGPLEKEFSQIAPTHILKGAGYSGQADFFKKGWNYLSYRIKKMLLFSRAKKADLIFNNTIANGHLISELGALRIPVISYVHELESVINEFNINGASDLAIRHSDYFIVPSEITGRNLVKNHGVAPEKLFRLNYFVPSSVMEETTKPAARQSFLQRYALPTDKFMVVGMGTASYRKGIDLFLETCKEVCALANDVYFVWIGDTEGEMKAYLSEKIIEYRLSSSLKMTGKIPYSPTTMLPFDLFILTSREDPYPLVVLEAASVKLPAICFEGAGGASDFVADGAGWAIPGFSAKDMADKILEVKHSPDLKKHGEKAYRKAMEWHSDGKLVLDQFITIVETATKCVESKK